METINNLSINNIILSSKTKSKISRNNFQKSILIEFNLNKIGSIRYAKIHRSANSPLHKINDFNQDTEFCQCCNLPAEQEGVMEKFHFSDNPDKFVECGESISLYFTFFKYSIIVIIIMFLLSGIINIIFSKKIYEELYFICNSKLQNIVFEDCKLYSKEETNTKSYAIISNSFFFMFNSINIKYYRDLYYKVFSNNNSTIESVIINLSFINFICLITLLIFNEFFIIIINTKSQDINKSIVSLNDYSIFLSNLKDIYQNFLKNDKQINEKNVQKEKNNIEDYKEEINNRLGIEKSSEKLSEIDKFKNYLKNEICTKENGEKLNVKKINICFNISELMNLQKKVNKIDEKMSKIRNQPYQILKNEKLKLYGDKKRYFGSFFDLNCCEKSQSLEELKEKKNKLNEEIDKLMEKSKKNSMDYFSGNAIICFDSIKEREDILNINSNYLIIYIIKLFIFFFFGCCIEKNKKDKYWLRKNIRFQLAPEPEEIIFENLEYSHSLSGYTRIFFAYFLSLILIFICFLIVISLNYLQKYTDEKNNFNRIIAYIISFLITCSIEITNYIFEKILNFLTKIEKNSTTTNFYLSKSIKLTIFSFTNEAIVPLISEILIDTNGYEYLVINMIMIFLTNSITPIFWAFNFSFFYKKFRIWLIEKNIKPNDPDGNHEKTQKELNELYELPSMEIEEKYSYIYKTILITFFYIQIFPLGIIFSLTGLCLGYLIEKYNFCNMYRRPEVLNDQLFHSYIDNFMTTLFICGVGDYIFKNDVYNSKLWPFINIFLFGVLMIIPYNYFIDYFIKYCINLRKSKIIKTSLEKVYFSFFNDYERANPMTKKEGIVNYLTGIKNSGIISEVIYLKYIGNLNNVNLMKLYYDDRKHINIIKAYKSILRKETIIKSISQLVSKISFKTLIKEENNEEDSKSDDSSFGKNKIKYRESNSNDSINDRNNIINQKSDENIINNKDEDINFYKKKNIKL